MAQIKTSELKDAELDWAVAKCEGAALDVAEFKDYGANYSTDWAQGGPIIEREYIELKKDSAGAGFYWVAELEHLDADDDKYAYGYAQGQTPLIAAMRCYVASKLGDMIEVPDELVKE